MLAPVFLQTKGVRQYTMSLGCPAMLSDERGDAVRKRLVKWDVL
jgi:hypothetical protein